MLHFPPSVFLHLSTSLCLILLYLKLTFSRLLFFVCPSQISQCIPEITISTFSPLFCTPLTPYHTFSETQPFFVSLHWGGGTQTLSPPRTLNQRPLVLVTHPQRSSRDFPRVFVCLCTAGLHAYCVRLQVCVCTISAYRRPCVWVYISHWVSRVYVCKHFPPMMAAHMYVEPLLHTWITALSWTGIVHFSTHIMFHQYVLLLQGS